MTPQTLHDRAARFAARLATTPQGDRHDAVANEVLETGGTYTTRADGTKCLSELSLHGLTTIGDSEASAIAAWLRLASAHGRRHEGKAPR